MTINLELQIASDAKTLPHPSLFQKWIALALGNRAEGELTVRIVDETESQGLNHQYREKNYPTNVLSFPYKAEVDIPLNIIGDIVLCAPIIEQEAIRQNKALVAHWAHLTIHGALHLIGYDHQLPQETIQMESLETQLLVELGFPPPYGDNNTDEH